MNVYGAEILEHAHQLCGKEIKKVLSCHDKLIFVTADNKLTGFEIRFEDELEDYAIVHLFATRLKYVLEKETNGFLQELASIGAIDKVAYEAAEEEKKRVRRIVAEAEREERERREYERLKAKFEK